MLSIDSTILVLSSRFRNLEARGITMGLLVPATMAPRITPSITLFSSEISINPEKVITITIIMVTIILKQKPVIVKSRPLGAPLNS